MPCCKNEVNEGLVSTSRPESFFNHIAHGENRLAGQSAVDRRRESEDDHKQSLVSNYTLSSLTG